jgi:glycosyltransferase involved in cell wall biosynthesis
VKGNPVVTIYCTTYNHEKYIAQAIEGFLIQKTNFPIEVIIHDDASTDNTANIIRQYENNYSDIIKGVYQKENQYHQRNIIYDTYIKHLIRGQYVARCEGDDYWTNPFKLQKQVDFLEKNKDFSMCFTNFNIVDAKGHIIEEDAWPWYKKRNMDTKFVLKYGVPRTLTTLIRKDVKSIIMSQDLPLMPLGDNLMFALATKYGDAGYLDINSACYRYHNQGVWSQIGTRMQTKKLLETINELKKIFISDEEQEALNVRIRRILVNIVYTICEDNEWDIDILIESKVDNIILSELYNKYLEVLEEICTFESVVHNSIETIRKKEIILFGASNYANRVYKWLLAHDIFTTKVVDNDAKKWGENLYDLTIESPEVIKKDDNQFVFITSRWYEDIEYQLNGLGLERNRDYISFF